MSVFINLPVSDVDASVEFLTKVGLTRNEEFPGSVLVSGETYALLVDKPFFAEISGREVADTATHAEVVLGLQVESRERVDEMVEAAVAAGGTAAGFPMDEGFMYSRGFRDIDGHLWNVLTMTGAAGAAGTAGAPEQPR